MDNGYGLGGVPGDSTLGSTGRDVVGGQVRPLGPPTPEVQPCDAGRGGHEIGRSSRPPAGYGPISDCDAASILSAVDAAADACRDTAGPLRTIITGIGANLRRLARSAPRDRRETIDEHVSKTNRRPCDAGRRRGPVAALIGTLDRHGYGAFADIVVAHWDGTSESPTAESPTAEPPTPRMAFVPVGPTAPSTFVPVGPPSAELPAFPMTSTLVGGGGRVASTLVGPTGPERVPTPAEMAEMDEFFADVNGAGDETFVDGDAGSAGGAIRRTKSTVKSAARAGPYGGRGNEDAGGPLPGLSDVAPTGLDCVGAPRPGWISGFYEHKWLAGSPGHPGLHGYRYIVVESGRKKTMTVWTWASGAGADAAKKSGAAAARALPPWATALCEVAGWPSANCGGLVRGPATVPVCVQRKERLNRLGSSYFQDPVPDGKPNSAWLVIRSDYRCVHPGPTDE